MRLLADENIPAPLVRALREQGIDVLYIAEFNRGITDEEVLRVSVAERRPILTEDRDFGELVFRFKRAASGIVLLRFRAGDRAQWPRLIRLLEHYAEKLQGTYVVVETERFQLCC